MPSFRAIQEITDVRPGHRPDEVMDAAVAACMATDHVVEARDIEVIAGRARIWVRYIVPDASTSEEELEAREVAAAIAEAVREVAHAGVPTVFRRLGGRWTRVLTPPHPR